MEARDSHTRIGRVARVATAILAILLAVCLWQAYGAWLFGMVGA